MYWSTVSAASLLFIMIVLGQETNGRTYIVHVHNSHRPAAFASACEWYRSMLASARGVELQDFDDVKHGPMYSYGTVFHGFAAVLGSDQAQDVQKMPGVVSVVEDSVVHSETTRTPQFIGLNRVSELWPTLNVEDQVIIGLIDSGIWPERKSFDKMLGPIPARWKGECESAPDFNASLVCNRKLIGARSFSRGYQVSMGQTTTTGEYYNSARDINGHGTHTASTASGSYVNNASMFGYASGTARGIAPFARISVYKVLWGSEYPTAFDSDILAAFEQAILDGVDIISFSITRFVGLPYVLDSIAIGSFRAMERGILVSAAAGNEGPKAFSVSNVAPWILTVGASSIDRDFPALVTFANNVSYTGTSIYSGNASFGHAKCTQVPLVLAANVHLPNRTTEDSTYCLLDTLDPFLVKGKMVVCDNGVNAPVEKGMVVQKAGGVGMILIDARFEQKYLPATHVLPAVTVNYEVGAAIKEHLTSEGVGSPPKASIISKGTAVGLKPAPVIAPFSSRGPSKDTPEILKPDLTAPGVAVLAAWSGRVGPSGLPGDDRNVDFALLSGTSMACPHISGLAALLRGVHPEWSPSAIKSALMTTAFTVDNTGNTLLDSAFSLYLNATPFAYGNGHVNPVRALDPGLVYDLQTQDYVNFLCGQNFFRDNNRLLQLLTLDIYECSSDSGALNPSNLNYPSLSFVYHQGSKNAKSWFSSTVTRTVTNVGAGSSVYTVQVRPPPGVSIQVEPSTLSFTTLYEKKTYTALCQADVKPGLGDAVGYVHSFGDLIWSDETHVVRSSIAFTWTI